ncbi:hypothetical protein FSP39_006528 [Pinctada imbricata]|uniref:Galectin n=1 Tax=Pinctada imbricata TaxID=66713 RepID=A0AA88XVP1_PINIB|nr:hypothetical protein FSP39_006528 [Pinctada imbricata]
MNSFLSSFYVNLADPGPSNDIGFHFNPRLNKNAVIRNSMLGGKWGREERGGGMPFHRGQHFSMGIQVLDREYRVMVNNNHFCSFNFRGQPGKYSELQGLDATFKDLLILTGQKDIHYKYDVIIGLKVCTRKAGFSFGNG